LKKTLIILIFAFLSLTDFAQNITSSRAKELFGERFITAKEAGFPDSLEVPFTEDTIKYDFTSWLVPMSVKGVTQYRLIEARYAQNRDEKYDTLHLEDAEKLICLMLKVRPNFPDQDNMKSKQKYFYRTKEPATSKNGMKFRKTISYYNDQLLVVDLPVVAIAGVIEHDYISYLIENKESGLFLGFQPLPDDAPKFTEQGITILTLVYITP